MSNSIYDTMLKKHHKGLFTIPFDRRSSISRDSIHPFVLGYVKAILEDWPFNCLDDIEDSTFAQICRDCSCFWWRFRYELRELSWLDDMGLERLGHVYWYSRQGGFGGFDMEAVPDADTFHQYASIDKVWVIEKNDKLIYVWEAPDDATEGFDFM